MPTFQNPTGRTIPLERRKKIAAIIKKYFYTSRGEGNGTMRLNFTMTDEETIDLAVSTLAEVIKREM